MADNNVMCSKMSAVINYIMHALLLGTSPYVVPYVTGKGPSYDLYCTVLFLGWAVLRCGLH